MNNQNNNNNNTNRRTLLVNQQPFYQLQNLLSRFHVTNNEQLRKITSITNHLGQSYHMLHPGKLLCWDNYGSFNGGNMINIIFSIRTNEFDIMNIRSVNYWKDNCRVTFGGVNCVTKLIYYFFRKKDGNGNGNRGPEYHYHCEVEVPARVRRDNNITEELVDVRLFSEQRGIGTNEEYKVSYANGYYVYRYIPVIDINAMIKLKNSKKEPKLNDDGNGVKDKMNVDNQINNCTGGSDYNSNFISDDNDIMEEKMLMLIEKIANELKGIVDEYQRTILFYFCNEGILDGVKMCMDLGYDFFKKDVFGKTPLMYSHQDIFKFLMTNANDIRKSIFGDGGGSSSKNLRPIPLRGGGSSGKDKLLVDELKKPDLQSIKSDEQKEKEATKDLLLKVINGKENQVLDKIIQDYNTLDLFNKDIGVKECQILSFSMEKNCNTTNLNLSTNNIKDEGLQFLAKSLEKNKVVTKLNLAYNSIGDKGCEYLSRLLEENNSICFLNLSYNSITSEGCEVLYKTLIKNNSLRCLDFSENHIRDKGCERLAKSLENNKSINELYLSGNRIGDRGCEYLSESMEKNKTVKKLFLSSNEISVKGCKCLVRFLKKHNTITCLDLSINSIGDQGCKHLGESLEKNNSITHLFLNDNEIGKEGCKDICNALAKNCTVTHLYFNKNQFGVDGCQDVAKLLEKNSTIQYLHIANNKIGDDGCIILSSSLEKNCSLFRIELSNNEIGEKGFEKLAKSLKVNHCLMFLDLSYNDGGDKGCHALADCLDENCTITILDLSFNNIKDHGCEYLAKSLENNISLIKLSLLGNSIGDEGCKHFASSLEKNTSLTTLKLQNNMIGGQGIQSLVTLLEKKMKQSIILNVITGIKKVDSVVNMNLKNVQTFTFDLKIDVPINIKSEQIDDGVFPYMIKFGDKSQVMFFINALRKKQPYYLKFFKSMVLTYLFGLTEIYHGDLLTKKKNYGWIENLFQEEYENISKKVPTSNKLKEFMASVDKKHSIPLLFINWKYTPRTPSERFYLFYRKNIKNGKAVYYVINNAENVYEGGVKNGKSEGNGVYHYKNGDKYKGEFKNGKKEGNGVYFYKSGSRFEGMFRNGKMEGSGIHYYKNGSRFEGMFKNGKKEGRGIFFYKNGSKYEEMFKNGKKQVSKDLKTSEFIRKSKIEDKGVIHKRNKSDVKNVKTEGKKVINIVNEKKMSDFKKVKKEGIVHRRYKSDIKSVIKPLVKSDIKNGKKEGKEFDHRRDSVGSSKIDKMKSFFEEFNRKVKK